VSTWFRIKGSVEVELYCPSVATLTKLGSIGQLGFSTQASGFRCDLGNPFSSLYNLQEGI
jgi:hypothetical protein